LFEHVEKSLSSSPLTNSQSFSRQYLGKYSKNTAELKKIFVATTTKPNKKCKQTKWRQFFLAAIDRHSNRIKQQQSIRSSVAMTTEAARYKKVFNFERAPLFQKLSKMAGTQPATLIIPKDNRLTSVSLINNSQGLSDHSGNMAAAQPGLTDPSAGRFALDGSNGADLISRSKTNVADDVATLTSPNS
jgi:hypothetical protein